MSDDPLHILLVDDDEDHIELIRRAFISESKTFNFIPASTLAEARQVLKKSTPDLMIVDFRLPDGKGMELLPGNEEKRTVPIVILTGHGNEEVAAAIMKAGAMDYIIKSDETFVALPRIVERVLCEWQNITERKKAETALEESAERLSLVLEATQEGVWEWNILTNYEFFSPRWCEILGYSFDDPELSHTFDAWKDRIHPDDVDRVMQALDDTLKKASIYDVEYRHLHKSGEYRWQKCSGTVVYNEDKKPVRMVGSIRDISKRKQMEVRLSVLASTDGLTSLYNRIHFNERLEDEVQRAIRFKTPLSLLMLDLDHFKSVNDTYGHPAGDACLVALADLMRRMSRTVDTCARYGGEEFVIILPQTPPENAMGLAERLRQKVEALKVQCDDQTIQYTISIGISALRLTEENAAEALLKAADSALYKAKESGRNCVISCPVADPSI